MNAHSSTLTSEQADLAMELGWNASASEETDWLQCLLDDEFEQLEPADRGRLRARLMDHASAQTCGDCGNVFLGRYRPDNARCRVCAAPLEVPTNGRPTSAALAIATTVTPEAAWDSADALSLGHSVVIDDENEDWDDRAERIERERAETDRLRRQDDLAQQQAEARRVERERRRAQLAELIPPVSLDKLSQLKRDAHQQIEERLANNRRRRRLLRGGRLKGR